MNIEEMKKRKSELGYSYELIAELSGVPLSTVQKIFSGVTQNPRYETLMALENVLAPGTSRVAESIAPYLTSRQGEYTIEDYYKLPDDCRAELIDGVIYYMTAPLTIHQYIIPQIWSILNEHIRRNKGGCVPMMAPTDVYIMCDGRTMVQPDIFVVCNRDKLTKKRIEGAPDLVIEVLSPSTRRKDMTVKLNKYSEAGVREYWIVDIDNRKVIVYLLDGDMIPRVYTFADKVPVAIFDNECEVDFAEIDEQINFMYDLV